VQAIFNAAKKDPLCFGKFIFTKISCLFYIINTQTIYVYQIFNDMKGFVKLRAAFKLFSFFYFFSDTRVENGAFTWLKIAFAKCLLDLVQVRLSRG
jgi:hypothetical protein